MTYQIVYTSSALKDIHKLDRVAKKKIQQKIEFYMKNPMPYAKRLLDSKLGEYGWRIGDYRIIFDLDRQTIVVLRVKHRRESYRA